MVAKGTTSESPSLSPAEDIYLGAAAAQRGWHGGFSFHRRLELV
jgi:hypothetical protein